MRRGEETREEETDSNTGLIGRATVTVLTADTDSVSDTDTAVQVVGKVTALSRAYSTHSVTRYLGVVRLHREFHRALTG